MNLSLKAILASFMAVGLSTVLTSVNASTVTVGDLTLDWDAQNDIPDLTNSSALLDYTYTTNCFVKDTSSGPSNTCGLNDQGTKYTGAIDAANSGGLLTITDTSTTANGQMAIDNGGLVAVGGDYSLEAYFDIDGIFTSSGSTVSLTGSALGFSGPDIISGSLTDFGFQSGVGINAFDLLFAVDFNETSDFGAIGTAGGLHVSSLSIPLGGDWLTSWQVSTVQVNTAVTTVVPVPAAAWLFGSGLLALAGVARRRR